MMMLNPTTMVYFRSHHPPSYPRVARVVKYLLENGERPLRFLFPNKRMDEIFVCEAPLNYPSDPPYEARFEGYTAHHTEWLVGVTLILSAMMLGVLGQLDELNGDHWERAEPIEFLTKTELQVVLRNRLQECRTAFPLCQLTAIGLPSYEFGKDQTLAWEPLVTEHTTDGVCGLLVIRVI